MGPPPRRSRDHATRSRQDLFGLPSASIPAHHGLSLGGVLFNGYLLHLQAFVIRAMCIWCLTFESATLLAFVAALVLYLRQPKPEVWQ